MAKKYAFVNRTFCVACGVCQQTCPKSAIDIWKGCYAKVDSTKCVGCGLCTKVCPANVISLEIQEEACEK